MPPNLLKGMTALPWFYGNHDGGGAVHVEEQIRFVRECLTRVSQG